MRSDAVIKGQIFAWHHRNSCDPVADLMPLLVRGIGYVNGAVVLGSAVYPSMGSIESGRATHHEGFPRTFPIISIPAPGQHGVADALINIAPENSQKTNQDIVPKQTARDAIKFRDTLIVRIGLEYVTGFDHFTKSELWLSIVSLSYRSPCA
jgi:hypothetical protein